MSHQKIIVIGGGAAGFFAAINIAQKCNDCDVVILEKTSKLLSKVRVSGGGRCNVTHACFDNSLLVKNYPRGEKELRNVFSRFSTSDTVLWFKQRGVELNAEQDGRIFPISNTSETIVNCLLSEAEKNGVKIKTGVDICEVIKQTDGTFRLIVNGGGEFLCDKLIIATGGNSKDAAYDWIRRLGHTIVNPVPSLFTFNIPDNEITRLMGVSVEIARVKIQNTKIETEGPLLITHWGMSGPAVLKASAWGARVLADMNYNFVAAVKWLPKFNEERLRIVLQGQKEEYASKVIQSTNPFELPKRLWEYIVVKSGILESERWADISKKQMNVLINKLLNDEYEVKGKTTFKEEFVTCGGIHLKEIDLSTMQSKVTPGLYFAGEIIDVDGITGGFNFQNAWSTAYVVSEALNEKGKQS